jgi:antitoxin FitA
MARLTIRNLEDGTKERLRIRAAMNGHSLEEEVRVILRQAVSGVTGPELWKLSRELFGGPNAVELEQPDRKSERSVPDFSSKAFGE